MNSARAKNKVEQKIDIKGDTHQIQSQEMAEEDMEVNQILKENQAPAIENNRQPDINLNQVAIPVNEDSAAKNGTKSPNRNKQGTESPYKNQKREKSDKAVELEFKWKDIRITAKPEKGKCEKYDPEKHSDKVSKIY